MAGLWNIDWFALNLPKKEEKNCKEECSSSCDKNPCKEIEINKPLCKKCGGTGILDFEFYTRDCFDCKGK